MTGFFKWLYPGMGVKRWIFLLIVGVIIASSIGLVAVRFLSHESILLASFVTALLIFGVFLIVMAVRNILRFFVRSLLPVQDNDLVDIIFKKRQDRFLERGPRVVVIGGGTGLSTLLQGVKKFTKNLTAIVTVTDTGGSSGRLRDELDVLPPGDIRNCLVALADAQPLMRDLFQYRFEDGSGLKGHSFGNLFITALSKITGDFERAIKESSKVLAIRGNVIPSTLEKVTLVAQLENGVIVEGETNITGHRKPIKKLELKPKFCRASEEALEAIKQADMIVLGPGSLYTSILPNLLIGDICKRIVESEALKIYVCNVMTQPGETNMFTAADHVDMLIRHTDPRLINVCVVNNSDIPDELIAKYALEQAEPVQLDIEKIKERGYQVVQANLIHTEDTVRHDPEQLARVIFETFIRYKRANQG